MSIKSATAALAALAASSSVVSAADLYRPYTPPQDYVERVEPWSWRGFYIGVNGGYAFGDAGFVEPDGLFGGGQAGFNMQFDRLVVGLEGDIQGADINDTTRFSFAGIPGRASVDVDWFSTLRGRVGLAHDRTLFYATAGLAWADVDQRVSLGGVTVSSDDVETGYAVGGGIEHALGDQWSIKAEYLYVDLGDIGGPTSSDLDFHTVRAGLNYKF